MTSTRALLVCAGLAAAVTLIAGAAAASPSPGSSTDVRFIAITPHRALSSTVAAHGHNFAVVIGGSTTVPTNATTVQMTVAVKPAAAGSLTIYPAGNPDGASGDSVSWTSVKGATATVVENVGTSNEVTFVNNSSRSILLTVTLTGYSTQVARDDINGSGGDPGQVLTDTGAGAAWQTPGTVYISRHPGVNQLWAVDAGFVATLYLPPGSYLLTASGTAQVPPDGKSGTAICALRNHGATAGIVQATVDSGDPDTPLTVQGVVTVGPIANYVGLACWSPQSAGLADYTFTAVPVGTVHDQS